MNTNVVARTLREKVWEKLKAVAYPDDQLGLGMNFNEFIPDFKGRPKAIKMLINSVEYKAARVVFITPDNSLRVLRGTALNDGKVVVTSNWGIRRSGFVLLDPNRIPKGDYKAAAYLKNQEEIGEPLTVQHLFELGKIDIFITGAGCVTESGIRFGKGHGFADLEWGIFYALQMVNQTTPMFVVVHDCQVISQRSIKFSGRDTVADVIFTPTRKIRVRAKYQKPSNGIVWDELEPDHLDNIPFLGQLRTWLEEKQEGGAQERTEINPYVW